MASLLFLLLLLIHPFSSLSDSVDNSATSSSAPISSIIPTTDPGTLPPSNSPYYFIRPAPFVGYLASFTGGKGNYPKMAREFLNAHNAVRATVQEHPFVWDRQLARFAKRWAEGRRTTCLMEHSMGPYGENMFWGSGWSWRAADAVGEWAKEEDFYNPKNNSCAPGQMCGHFTQIIWNSTVRIGCGRSECYNGGVIITCNYDPPGNYIGENPLTASVP